ncbi:MAG TPA: polysaccharide biosynthesis/export family protein [Beijerinckiaceae bacterium]|nr:polysaccharide biosynthesis/export family protein [Beijerinckiaceae bacterium]
MPGAGPSGQELIDAGTQANPQFALIEITDPVLAEIARWPGPSFYGRFGDYRGPTQQRIGVGDSVQITIWEAAAGGLFSSPTITPNSPGSRTAVIPSQVVAQDGAITVPYAGRIRVAGRTPPEVEAIIVKRLQGKAIEPQALVTVTKQIADSAVVTGEVVAGARVPLSARGDRIMDVIAEAGGVRAPVRDAFINLMRNGRAERVAMQLLLTDPKENIYVRPGDVITVVNDPQTFTVVGATPRNAVVPFDAVGITLDQALAKAGGLLDQTADPAGVFVLRYEPSALMRDVPGVPPALLKADLVPVAYHLDLRQPSALFAAHLFPIHNKDIIYVSDSPVTDLQKVFGLFQAVTAPTLNAATVKYYVN